MTARLLWAGLLLIPLQAHAEYQVIRFSCELDITLYMPFGQPTLKHERDDVQVELATAARFTAITIISKAIPVKVQNSRGAGVTAFVDNSDEARWDISSDRRKKDGLTRDSIYIDRSTGRLTAYSIVQVGERSFREDARGLCKKADT